MTDYRTELKLAIEAAREAGDLLREEFHREGGPRGEGPDHADADPKAERLIRDRLARNTAWSYLGEETGSCASDPSHIWLVDPNDGTSGYLEGIRGSAVSIALLRAGTPVLGVVYAFCFPDDEGDLVAWAEGCGPIERNGRPVGAALDRQALDKHAMVLVSKDADANPEASARLVAPARFLTLPSVAYRLALTAAGEAVAAVCLKNPCSWDYAAGHALIMAAGGVLVDEEGREVRYEASGASRVRFCIGGAPGAVEQLRRRPWADRGRKRDPQAGGSGMPCRLRPGGAFSNAGILARAQGCLLGQLAGDALGSLVEFQCADAIKRSFPDGVRDLADGGTFNTLAGQPTDDSEMALALARSLLREGRFDPDAVLEAYMHWHRSGPFDEGRTTAAALAGGGRSARSESQANGSLMRISPLAVFGFARPDEAVEWAREESGLTHPNPVCREACAAFVRAVTAALAGAGAADCHRQAVAEARRGANEPVIAALEAAAGSAPATMDDGRSGWVLVALQNAFYRLLHAENFETALVDTVMCGGDTDTNAAVCGALCGAVHGRDAIPARWRRLVLSCRPIEGLGARQPRPPQFWPVDAPELAESLLAASCRSVALGTRFQEATAFALELHSRQRRKGVCVPYAAHLLGVASIVMEAGGTESQAVAALLHDAIEDQGLSSEEIAKRFGQEVAGIVDGCTDSTERPKPPWPQRKRAYLARLTQESRATLLVSAADKLHNARAILRDCRELGDGVWKRFNAPREDVLGYYRGLVEVFRRTRTCPPIVEELARIVEALEGEPRTPAPPGRS